MIELRIGDGTSGVVNVFARVEGKSNELIDELAAGVAAVVMDMGDGYEGKDPIHEPLLEAVCKQAKWLLHEALGRRKLCADEPQEA